MQTAPYHALPTGKVAASYWHDNTACPTGLGITAANRQTGIGHCPTHCPDCLGLNCLLDKRCAPPVRIGATLVRHRSRRTSNAQLIAATSWL